MLLALPISDKFNFQFSVVLLLVTTKFILKEFIKFKSCIFNVFIIEYCWLGDFVRVNICRDLVAKTQKMKPSGR